MKLPTKAAIVAYAGDLAIVLTILASLPYELGDITGFIDPSIKLEIVKVGAWSSIALKALQRLMELFQGNKDATGIAANAATLEAQQSTAPQALGRMPTPKDTIPPNGPRSTFTAAPIVALLLACSLLYGCAAPVPLKQASKDFFANTTVTASASYDGVTISDTRTGQKRTVGIGVDAKQVKRAIDQR